MKKFQLLFVIGGLFLVIGFSTVYFYNDSILEKFPDLAIVHSNVLLEPSQSISIPLIFEKDEKIIFSVNNPTAPNLMYFSLKTPENLVALELTFNNFVSVPIVANSSGIHTIDIGNMGSQNANLNAFITKKPLLDERESLYQYGTIIATGSLLVFFGIILIIIGVIIFLINKKRSKTKVIKKK